MLRATLERTIKRALYRSGALDAWHRHRNRDRLTVVMFHRVLPTTDPRWATSDPEYTLAEDLFVACLAFFKRHYHVVSLADVLAARAGGPALPERSLLITFDDGWSDNAEFALRHLHAADLPAVVFVVSDAVGRPQAFWQEQMIGAWRAGRLGPDRAGALWREVAPEETPPRFTNLRSELDPLRALIARIEHLDGVARTRMLVVLAPVLDDGVRYMVTVEQLRQFAASRVAIGAHGETHDPLTEVDARAQLTTSRAILERQLGDGATVTTLSFPHGRFDDGVVTAAHAAGYHLMFTSKRELPAAAGSKDVLGRVGIASAEIVDPEGRFAPELLALGLFRRPHAG